MISILRLCHRLQSQPIAHHFSSRLTERLHCAIKKNLQYPSTVGSATRRDTSLLQMTKQQESGVDLLSIGMERAAAPMGIIPTNDDFVQLQ